MEPHCDGRPALVLKGISNLLALFSAKFVELVALRHQEQVEAAEDSDHTLHIFDRLCLERLTT